MSNKRKRSSASTRPTRPSTSQASAGGGRPWLKYVGYGLGGLVVVLLIVFIAGDQPDDIDLGAEPPEGTVELEIGTRDHVEGAIAYENPPPGGGPHNPIWQNCGFYDEPVRDENAVHTLEHGAIWIAFATDLDDSSVGRLRGFAERSSEILVSPYPGLDSAVVVTSWGHQLRLDSAEDPRIEQFISAFLNTDAPEISASCSGGVGRPA